MLLALCVVGCTGLRDQSLSPAAPMPQPVISSAPTGAGPPQNPAAAPMAVAPPADKLPAHEVPKAWPGAPEARPQPSPPLGKEHASEILTFLDETRECAMEGLGARLNAPAELRWFEASGKPLERRSLLLERGVITIINFWATWCEPCRDEMPSLLRLQKNLKGIGGNRLNLVFVSEDTDGEEISRYQTKYNQHFSTFVSPTAEMRNSIRTTGEPPGLPSTIIVDGSGKIRGCVAGQLDTRDLNNILMLALLLGMEKGR